MILPFKKKKLFVLSLDGTPHSFIKEAFENDIMPNFKDLAEEGSLISIYSTIPPVSSTAWATFMTGVNPARHGIFGFVDRNTNPLRRTILNASDLKEKTLWKRLSEKKKRCIVINVPVTYPPEPLNGILVSGFLGTNLEKITYPREFSSKLKEIGYIIDPDPRKSKDKEKFLNEILLAFERRKKLILSLIDKKWDFFMAHIMETDRINHFYWKDKEYEEKFLDFYKRVDDFLAEIISKIKNSELMILSDHGFCDIRYEVNLNEYLKREGFLNYKDGEDLEKIDHKSTAYSLNPGRVYINLKGREEKGSVDQKDYEYLREELKKVLLKFKDEERGEKIIERVYYREEIYNGPYITQAADLIALPKKGFDLKAGLEEGDIFYKTHLLGMHTFKDAFLFVRGKELKTNDNSMIDVTPTIFSLLNLDIPNALEGNNLIKE